MLTSWNYDMNCMKCMSYNMLISLFHTYMQDLVFSSVSYLKIIVLQISGRFLTLKKVPADDFF